MRKAFAGHHAIVGTGDRSRAPRIRTIISDANGRMSALAVGLFSARSGAGDRTQRSTREPDRAPPDRFRAI